MHLSAIFLFVLSCIGATYGYSSLRRQIPNGYKVPHPCRPGTTWDAVGHMAPEYDPTKNAFGKDVREVLKDRQLEWAKVCNKDSDGDGLTNGQELGDPSCMWKVSDGLQGLADPMGHPGICEPGRQQCTSGITFNECPNPFASGSSGPRITVPPGANDHPQTNLVKGTGTFSGSEPFQPNFAFSDGFGTQGGFQQAPSGGSFSQSRMSQMSGLQSPGSRGSTGFSGADSFGGRRPSFESQSRPEMGGQMRGSSPPGFRGPAGSPSGFGGQRPSFGSQSQTSFGGPTGFDGQPGGAQMGGHTFSDHSSGSMGMPDFNAAGTAGSVMTGPGFAPVPSGPGFATSGPGFAGAGKFGQDFASDIGAPMGFEGAFSGMATDPSSRFRGRHEFGTPGGMGGGSTSSFSHAGGSGTLTSGFGQMSSDFSGFGDPTGGFSMTGPPRGAMSFRPGSMPVFMQGGHRKPGFGSGSSLSSDVIQRSVQSRLDQERGRMGGSTFGTSVGHISAPSHGALFGPPGISARLPGLGGAVPMYPPLGGGAPRFFR